MKKQILFFLVLFFFLPSLWGTDLHAQDPIEMADGLRSSGKIYIVVTVLVTILLGLILFLLTIDRKVSNLEKKIDEN